MVSGLAAVSIVALALSGPTSAPDDPREIDNVAAFARLYGVVRYFYPSDAAAALDWNRFAEHGVARVRGAKDRDALAAALQSLVAPLGPDIEIAPALAPAADVKATAEPLVAWRYFGAAVEGTQQPYAAKRTHRPRATAAEPAFLSLVQMVPAQEYRGRTIRLQGQIRATAAAEATARAALWLRVDRPNQATGFFDNMDKRPVREAEWRPYVIEGAVADDAQAIAFGVMGVGTVTADFGPVELAVRDAAGAWTPIAIKDPGFESAVATMAAPPWRVAGTGQGDVSRPAQGGPGGGPFVRLTAPAPDAPDTEIFTEGAPQPGAHADLDLGAGLHARVPLALTEGAARPDPRRAGDLAALRAALAAAPGPGDPPDLDQRLADVVVGWNVFRHFYPYWPEVGVEWDGRLVPQLEAARAARTRAGQRDVLRGLTADARDGHARVSDTLDTAESGELPVQLRVVEGRLAIVASAVPEAPVGSSVWTIDGTPAAQWLDRALGLASGSLQWRKVAALRLLTLGPKGGRVTLGVGSGSSTEAHAVTLTYGAPAPPVKRPEPLAELEPGLWYVDLTRAKMEEIEPRLATLAAARGVVFDVRGYPTDAGAALLPYLLAAPETDHWMHVPRIVGPSFELAGWESVGWELKPASPHIGGRIVFLTDGSAISYAESVMGYVADRKLGTIVGSMTAGTNGNVNRFSTPGGFKIAFTGLRVTRHDGRSPYHLLGVGPVGPEDTVLPTVEGIRAGRDEVLERGVAVAKGGPSPPPR